MLFPSGFLPVSFWYPSGVEVKLQCDSVTPLQDSGTLPESFQYPPVVQMKRKLCNLMGLLPLRTAYRQRPRQRERSPNHFSAGLFQGRSNGRVKGSLEPTYWMGLESQTSHREELVQRVIRNLTTRRGEKVEEETEETENQTVTATK